MASFYIYAIDNSIIEMRHLYDGNHYTSQTLYL